MLFAVVLVRDVAPANIIHQPRRWAHIPTTSNRENESSRVHRGQWRVLLMMVHIAFLQKRGKQIRPADKAYSIQTATGFVEVAREADM